MDRLGVFAALPRAGCVFDADKSNHENTKLRKHERRKVQWSAVFFVFSGFRVFVIAFDFLVSLIP